LRSSGQRTGGRAPRRPRRAPGGWRYHERGQLAHGVRGVQPREVHPGRAPGGPLEQQRVAITVRGVRTRSPESCCFGAPRGSRAEPYGSPSGS
jgi:hypothetical protein